MNIRNGIAKRTYIIITLIVTIPMLFFAYYDSMRLKTLLIEQKNHSLLEISIILKDQLAQSPFHDILSSEKILQVEKNEQIKILHKHLQPLLTKIARLYPNYSFGFYSRQLDCIVAVQPNLYCQFIGKKINTATKLKLYQTGQPQTGYLENKFAWDGKPTLNLDYPLYQQGKLIGHIWINTKIEDINKEFYLILTKKIIFIFLIWLISMDIIRLTFVSLENALSDLALKIKNEEDDVQYFKDFPQLVPLLETIIDLREKLKNETKKLNQLIQICPLSILVIDKNGKIMTANKAFLKLCPQFHKNNIINKPYKIIACSLGLPYEKTKIIRALKGEEIIEEYSNKPVNRHWIINALPIRDAETNSIIGAMAIYHDVTEHEQFRKEMFQTDRLTLIAEMAAGVAHEIRNPMTVIRGYLQLLMNKFEKELGSYFNILIEEVDRANSIITDFLSLAKNKPSEKSKQNINEIIKSLYPLIYSDAMKSEISITLKLAEKIPLCFLNDKEIKQLILNLTRNAIEAIKNKGNITIETRNRYNKLELIISDNGCGIPKEQLSRAFNPFFTTKDNGTGLGLAVSLGIVNRHQGTIDIESEKGVGTKFTITFNIAN